MRGAARWCSLAPIGYWVRMQSPLRYFGLPLYVVLCFVIATVADAPTSVILLVLLSLLALGLSVGASRRAR